MWLPLRVRVSGAELTFDGAAHLAQEAIYGLVCQPDEDRPGLTLEFSQPPRPTAKGVW